jgi:hypothetical protein
MGEGTLQAALCMALAARAASKAKQAIKEVADTRAWNTLPSEIRLGRLKLPPGKHEVTVRFLSTKGKVISTTIFNEVIINRGKRSYLAYRTSI